jgi:Zn-dependent protease
MNGNLRIGSLFGIPFYVNFSWFLILALVTWDYGQQFSAFPGLGAAAWVLGLGTALLLFASVLAHELGHSLVAMRQGIPVNSITLFIFGGLASLGEESKTPADAFWVAIAGPLVSLGLFGLLTGVESFAGLSGPLAAIVSLIAALNLALALFNLLPGLPLDGGNVLKAIVWKITGKPYRGIAFASRAGQVLGWTGIGLGILGELNISPIGNIWTLLIGWFLLQNAGRYAQAASVQEQMSGLTAADATITPSPIVQADLSLREFANQHIIGSPVKWKKYFVVNEIGEWIGEINVESMNAIPTNDWWNVSVRELMQPKKPAETIVANQPLLDVVTLLEQKKLTELVVLGDGGALVGLLDRSSVAELLQRRADAKAAPVAEAQAPEPLS